MSMPTPWMRLQMLFWGSVCRWYKARRGIVLTLRRWDAIAADPRIQFLILFQAAVRGSNYIIDPPNKGMTATLSLTEQALPLPVWGFIYLGFAAIGTVGLFYKRLPLLQIGHFATAGVYAAFAFGAEIEYFRDGANGNYRTGTGFAIVALVNLIFAKKSEAASRRARLAEGSA